MPKDIFQDLKKIWICGQRINISRLTSSDSDKNKPGSGTKGRRESSKKSRAEKKRSASGKKKKKKVVGAE